MNQKEKFLRRNLDAPVVNCTTTLEEAMKLVVYTVGYSLVGYFKFELVEYLGAVSAMELAIKECS